MRKTPICIDLDGTLTPLDTLLVALFQLLWRKPWALFGLFFRLSDKVGFKAYLARVSRVHPARIPYNKALIKEILAFKQAGHPLYLVTGTYESIAKDIADHLGYFDGYYATKDVNLTGSRKAAQLNKIFGEKTYLYAGNSVVDYKVWPSSKEGIVVGPKKIYKRAMSMCPVHVHIESGIKDGLAAYVTYFRRKPPQG